MEHLAACQEILEQLMKDFPLPESSNLVVSYQPVDLIRRGRVTGGGMFTMSFGIAYIDIAMADNATLRMRLERVAHEYRHAFQRLVNNKKIVSGYNSWCEVDARAFASKYTKEYMTTRCMA